MSFASFTDKTKGTTWRDNQNKSFLEASTGVDKETAKKAQSDLRSRIEENREKRKAEREKEQRRKTPAVKGVSFANKREKRDTKKTAFDKTMERAGNTLVSAETGMASAYSRAAGVLADAIVNSRKSAESIRTPIGITKGSVFANRGYDPFNAERSQRETENMEKIASGIRDFSQNMRQREIESEQAAKEGLGAVGTLLVDLGKTGTQMAGDAALNAVVPGAGIASLATRSFGQGVASAEEQGRTGANAVLYGLGNAAIEAGTEKISAAAKPLKAVYGGGVLDDVVERLTRKLLGDSRGRQALALIGRSAGGEAAEEAIANVLQVPLQNITLQNGAQYDAEWLADTAYQALLGGILGGTLGGASVAADTARNRTAQPLLDAINRAGRNRQNKSPASAAADTGDSAGTAPGTVDTVNRRAGLPDNPASVNSIAETMQNINKNVLQTEHIDSRTPESVKGRNVNAFQYDHPEMQEYYREAAEDLAADADLSLGMSAGRRWERTMQGRKLVQDTQASPQVRAAMESGLSRADIIKGAQDILADKGQENNANAKRVELVLDDMLEHGYKTMFGKTAGPNDAYIAAKGALPGAAARAESGSWEQYLEENRLALELGEVTEEQLRAEWESRSDGLGAADLGSLNSPYENLQAQSSQFYPEGANAARPVDVPMRDFEGNPISKSASTVMGAQAIPDDVVPEIEDMIANGQLSYTRRTDADSLQHARDTIIDKGFDGAMEEFRAAVNSNKVSKDIATLGQTLLNTAANNRDGNAVAELLMLYQTMNTNAGQAVQAASIFRKLSPESQLYGIRKSVSNMNGAIRKLRKKYKDAKIDEGLIDKFLKQEDQEGRNAVMGEIYQNVADQVPANWKDKWDAWRYLAMLGNPRTHIRNIVGNAVFQPARIIKNEVAAGIEAGLNAAGIPVERTHAFAASPAMYRAAWNDYDNAAPVLGGSKYDDVENAVERRRRIFKNPALEKARKASSAALEMEDVVFKRITYADTLASYLQANGVTAEQLASGAADSALLSKAREYAAKEALRATYQDRNKASNKVTQIVRAAGPVGDAIMPFKRTPTNILVRGFEYSPLGAAKAVYDGLRYVRSGEKTAAEVIDEAAAGLTGSALMALGAYLLSAGLVTGSSGDSEDDKWAELLGHQSYALELPNGVSTTIDWMAPASLPFFMGVELMSSVGENGWTAESIWNALKSVANPMLELSMLQSVNDLIESVQYAEEAPLVAMIPSTIISYFSQGIPTVGGQIERTGEGRRMTTYTDKNSRIPTDVQYAIGRASSRIPGWDFQQVPYIDAWGQEESTGTPFMRAFNNFINPSYNSTVEADPVEQEIQSVRDATGDAGVFPERAKRYVTVNGERKDLTTDEYIEYAKTLGQTQYSILQQAFKSDAYKGMTPEEKAEFIGDVYTYAAQTTENELFGDKMTSWVGDAKESGDIPGYIGDRIIYGGDERAKRAVEEYGLTKEQYTSMKDNIDLDGNGSVSQKEAQTYLDSQDFTREQKAGLWNIINKSWKRNPYQ